MPIYAYKCASCGYAQDVLQKISDPLLTVCPRCGEPAFQKQVTAAGFQLKGSGWYVTDFRGGGNASPNQDGKAESKPDQAKGDAVKPESKPEPKGESKNQSSSGGTASTPPSPAPSSSGGGTGGD